MVGGQGKGCGGNAEQKWKYFPHGRLLKIIDAQSYPRTCELVEIAADYTEVLGAKQSGVVDLQPSANA